MVDINKYINESLFSGKSEEDMISAAKREIALEELKKYGYDLIPPSVRKSYSPLNPKAISKQVEVTPEGKIKIILNNKYYLLSIENIKSRLNNPLNIIDIEYPGSSHAADVYIIRSPGLATLEDIFDPAAEIYAELNINDCKNLQSLKGLPKFKTPGKLYVFDCPIYNLEGLEKNSEYDYINLASTKITEEYFYKYINSHNIKVEDFDIYDDD